MGIATAYIHATISHMNKSTLLPVFAATLFTSAFLIFAVQPMASKMLLPLLGGSPSVWNTAMVFFQAMLLAGYAYAHFVSKVFPLRIQALLHIALLALFTVFLPLAIPSDIAPPDLTGQAMWQLGVMLTCIGGPFFILAASAPLFQHWFASSGHKDAENPYFLYAVSNIGSMIALLGYPFVMEPFLTLTEQTNGWFGGYVLLIALVALCGFLVRNGVKPVAPIASNADTSRVTWTERAVWTFLAFIPSSLMLGVTTLITTDLASAPLLWIIPLAIYLATFIIAFSKKPLMGVAITRELTPYILCIVILLFMLSGFIYLKIPMIIVHLLTFYMCALLCHGELAQAKPSTTHLTEYFLIVSFGGVLGGVFNALIAPQIFVNPLEYSLSLAAIGFIVWAGFNNFPVIRGKFNATQDPKRPVKILMMDVLTVAVALGLCAGAFMVESDTIQMCFAVAIFVYLLMTVQKHGPFAFISLIALVAFQSSIWSTEKGLLAQERSYFGILKVYADEKINFLYHGTTLHGAQFREGKQQFMPVTYYSPGGPASDVFAQISKKRGKQEVGVIGLGVGSVVCYKAPGRHFDFFEIDQDVAKYAEDPKYFTYLSGCKSPYDIIIGDGRLKIAEKPDKTYDMIFLDAFSSDNIPIHVMTKEAFEIYFDKLKDGGVITMNISNRYLDLRPVLVAIGKELGYTVYFKFHVPKTKKDDVSAIYTPSMFALMAKDEKTLAPYIENYKDWKPYKQETTVRAWTDDYANILATFVGVDGLKQ